MFFAWQASQSWLHCTTGWLQVSTLAVGLLRQLRQLAAGRAARQSSHMVDSLLSGKVLLSIALSLDGRSSPRPPEKQEPENEGKEKRDQQHPHPQPARHDEQGGQADDH